MDDPLIGSSMGELMVVARLGEGATCVVYEAWDPAGNRRAVRIFKPGSTEPGGLFANLSALSKELIAVQLPGVAAHHGVGVLDDGRPYATNECVDGEPLTAWVRRKAPVPVDDLLTVCARLCQVLHSVHTRGLAHGALTAAKVFCVSSGPSPEVRVIGLGLTRAHLGWAPNAPPSPRDDLHAVGVWLEGALDGRPVPPPVSALVESLVGRSTSAPASAAEAARVLLAAIAGSTEPAPAPRPDPAPADGVFHTTAEILAQHAGPAPAVPKTLKPARDVDSAEEPPARVPRVWIFGGGLAALLVAALGVWAGWPSQGAVEPKAAVAPPPAVVRPRPVDPPPPVAPARAAPSARALVARANALTAELKRHPQTTYDARTTLRALLTRCQANPDEAARAALADELDHWQRTYLPGK